MTTGPERPHRATLFVEAAEILAKERFPGDQVVLRIHAPRIAAVASPGTFLHVRCDPALPLRRPISLMAADPAAGQLSILFKVVGKGTGLLAARAVGEVLDVIGPIGTGFRPREDRPRALLLAGGMGIPPMVFLAHWLTGGLAGGLAGEGAGGLAGRLADGVANQPTRDPSPPQRKASFPPMGPSPSSARETLLLMGSERPFPFTVRPSGIPVSVPDGVTAAMAPMEALGIPSRLASRQGYPGCFPGWVTELAEFRLAAQPPAIHRETALYACGPEPMLRASAALARKYDLPCQVCLEEFMACGVGACAGCAVAVTTPAGVAMKRVCVDGPVFDARMVFG
uniref:Dihydroorotate dehydrogenase electron transfer subunit n=1 Tax=Candidatus Kentrum sp. FM TaxID=2126340 RepID=A0A450TH73_9GAMM|nr:MAG: dihydroorotate dehydrogenase electron transfer subunit [Candidatus Kentron sp. FM]VFJ66484.1 MAG: dihydroorotate dehydrogenase electron transfer subunit [Candidatus Kentron sp. FM]VFK16038.1 MAG: dihydroorotate dehydrogenase electron transfer subunit [Candidatus Kentron sp. FM]